MFHALLSSKSDVPLPLNEQRVDGARSGTEVIDTKTRARAAFNDVTFDAELAA